MERPLTKRTKLDHLICRSGWALLLTIVCVSFAYRVLSEIRLGDDEVQSSWWKTLTWAVWAVLALGLISEVRCWRERLLFAVLFMTLMVGCVFSLWASAPVTVAREVRWVSLSLWCLAALLSFVALVAARRSENDIGDASSGTNAAIG